MKHLLISLATILCGSVLHSQITVTSNTFPRQDDTLFTAVDNMPSGINVGTAGGGQSWNFTTLQSPFTVRAVVKPASEGMGAAFFPGAEIVMPYGENAAEGYYNLTSTKMELMGLYGQDPLNLGVQITPRFSPALVERHAPLKYLDNRQTQANLSYPFSADDLPGNIIDSLPITPDSLRVRINIQRRDLVDAWGTMTVPGGVYDVLRMKREQVQNIRLDAKIGFFGWQDITDIAIQFLNLGNVLGEITTTTYHFFNDEAKEPIAVVTMGQDGTTPAAVQYKANEILSGYIQTAGSLKPGVFAFPNPAIVNVRFEFTNLRAGQYRLIIYNILGGEVWSSRYYINGSRTEKVDISSLRKGTYLYSLVDDRGKTIVTRRLIVVRP